MGVVPLVVALAACGSDDAGDAGDAAGSDDTTTTAVDRSAEYLAAAEERGRPTIEPTEPVEELEIIDEVEGTGAEVRPGDTVTAHYVGVAATTGEEFDASWNGGQPLTFPLDGVIAGWQEGLVGMKEGGRRTLVIPAELAYGDAGPAPGDTLVFTIDLIAVN
jgi:peptidylprolyl isomerase